jgi:hypothetical protein
MTRRLRILVLAHERDTPRLMRRYTISLMAQIWRQDGHDVRFVFGTRDRPPADVILVHVDLSVVPQPYLELAASYPVALNVGAADIRKSVIAPDLRVLAGDGYEGPVIVKSDLNYAGLPERRRGGRRGALMRGLLARAGYPWPPGLRGSGVYRV